jgi:hypothetical protein
MPPVLVIEDGTAATLSANSYVTVAEVTTFCSDYGLSSWALLGSTDKITAILRGMAFVDSEFDFKGVKTNYYNPLEWPRYGVYDDLDSDSFASEEMEWYQEIPSGVKKAACRAAYEESASAGVLQASLTSNIRSQKIDVIEVEYFGQQPSKTIYRTIQGFLKGLIRSSNAATILRT